MSKKPKNLCKKVKKCKFSLVIFLAEWYNFIKKYGAEKKMKFTPKYDGKFYPMSVVLRDFEKDVNDAPNKILKICV